MVAATDHAGVHPDRLNPISNQFRPLLFLCSSLAMILLCVWGGQFGDPGAQVWMFIFLFIATGVVGLSLVLLLPESWRPGRRLLAILLVSVLARMALIPHPVSDDIFRYVWEGQVLVEGFSPYTYAPDHPQLTHLRDDAVWLGINHKDQTACYPPAMTLLFGAMAWLYPGVLPVKLLMIALDLLGVLALVLLLRERSLSDRWSLLYALNPIVLYSFSGQAHLDAAHVAFLTVMLLCYSRGRWVFMFFFLGLALQTKYVALLAVPFVLRRENLRFAWVGVLTAILPFLVFLPGDGLALFESLFLFGSRMAFGGLVHGVLRYVLGGIEPATRICGLLFFLTYAWTMVRFVPLRRSARTTDPALPLLIVFGALLVFSPTVHFWYLAWVLPLVALRPKASPVVLSLTFSFYFLAAANQHHGHGWVLPAWALWAMWLPPLILMCAEIRRVWKRLASGPLDSSVRSVSVVIPTRNEASCIGACIQAVLDNDRLEEILVVDSGSRDDTASRARALGARVISHTAPLESGGGRGGQICAGVQEACADVIAIVHADTLVSHDTLVNILSFLHRNPDAIGGAVGSRLEGRGFLLRLIELANDFRAGFMGISFGDQVQFFRRQAIDDGLVPNIPLMEDVETALRLRDRARTGFLWGSCRVSSRRWRKGGFARVRGILSMVGQYYVERLWRTPDTVAMYRSYYSEFPAVAAQDMERVR